MPETPPDTGWAHASDRSGHYLDTGEPLCGYDPGTFYGEMDVREAPPLSACRRYTRIVAAAGGSPRHRHRWMDSGGFAGPERTCGGCGLSQPREP